LQIHSPNDCGLGLQPSSFRAVLPITMAMDPNKQELLANLEIEMMTDLYNRLSKTCHKKCIPPKYHEGDLSKGEAICLDRCVAKFMEVHDRVGKKLTSMSMPDEGTMKQMQAQGR